MLPLRTQSAAKSAFLNSPAFGFDAFPTTSIYLFYWPPVSSIFMHRRHTHDYLGWNITIPPTMQFCSFLFPIGLSVEKWVCILSWESFINDINGLVNTSYMPGTWQIGPLISFNVILTITLSNSGVPLYGWGAQPLWLAQGHRWFWYIPKFWERPSSPIC